MKRRIINLWLLLLVLCPVLKAQNWDYIRTSGEYYYGSGTGKTEAEADKAALNDLVQMIAVHVSSDFQSQTDETQANGNIDHKTYVRNCVSLFFLCPDQCGEMDGGGRTGSYRAGVICCVRS